MTNEIKINLVIDPFSNSPSRTPRIIKSCVDLGGRRIIKKKKNII
jgi:hypothetical protein